MHKPAPNFKLYDQDGLQRSLHDYSGSWLVLYFYPKDNSPGCTEQACAFRDENTVLAQFGNASIIGINKDSVISHGKFAAKHRLNFPLLSDPDLEVAKAYGAWKTGKARLFNNLFTVSRNTYLINPEGIIVKEYLGINPKNHITNLIADLQALQNLSKD